MSAGNVAGEAEQVESPDQEGAWFDKAVRFGLVVYGMVCLHARVGWASTSRWATARARPPPRAPSPGRQAALRDIHDRAGRNQDAPVRALAPLSSTCSSGARDEGADLWKHRASDLLKALLYGAICWSAISVLISSVSSLSTKDFSSTILGLPGEVWLSADRFRVVVYGEATRSTSPGTEKRQKNRRRGRVQRGRQGLRAVRQDRLHRQGHRGRTGRWPLRVRRVHRGPARSPAAPDEALHKVLEQPFGPWLLIALSLGITCCGLFQFARARHLSSGRRGRDLSGP